MNSNPKYALGFHAEALTNNYEIETYSGDISLTAETVLGSDAQVAVKNSGKVEVVAPSSMDIWVNGANFHPHASVTTAAATFKNGVPVVIEKSTAYQTAGNPSLRNYGTSRFDETATFISGFSVPNGGTATIDNEVVTTSEIANLTVTSRLIYNTGTHPDFFYVDDANGHDTDNNGSVLAPYKTIQAAVNRINSSTFSNNVFVIYVRAGTYVENVVISRGYVSIIGENGVLLKGQIKNAISNAFSLATLPIPVYVSGVEFQSVDSGSNTRCFIEVGDISGTFTSAQLRGVGVVLNNCTFRCSYTNPDATYTNKDGILYCTDASSVHTVLFLNCVVLDTSGNTTVPTLYITNGMLTITNGVAQKTTNNDQMALVGTSATGYFQANDTSLTGYMTLYSASASMFFQSENVLQNTRVRNPGSKNPIDLYDEGSVVLFDVYFDVASAIGELVKGRNGGGTQDQTLRYADIVVPSTAITVAVAATVPNVNSISDRPITHYGGDVFFSALSRLAIPATSSRPTTTSVPTGCIIWNTTDSRLELYESGTDTWIPISSPFLWNDAGGGWYLPDAQANLGIGTVNPIYRLHITSSDGYPSAAWTGTSGGQAVTYIQGIFDNDVDGDYAGIVLNSGTAAIPLILTTGDAWGTGGIFIDGSTNFVGINNTNPQYDLHVSGGLFTETFIAETILVQNLGAGDVNLASIVIQQGTNDATNFATIQLRTGVEDSATDQVVRWELQKDGNMRMQRAITNGVLTTTNHMNVLIDGKIGFNRVPTTYNAEFQGDVYATGNMHATAHITHSDRRVKEIIDSFDAEGYSDRIRNLHGRRYFNKLSNREEYGLIAQEVQLHFPELVTALHSSSSSKLLNACGHDDGDPLLAVHYSGLIVPMIDCIKNLYKRIEDLESKCKCISQN